MTEPMSLNALLSDESLRQHEFPVAADKVFWAHAGVAALPRRVAQAMQQYIETCTQGDQESMFAERTVLDTRKRAGELLGCTPQEIALLGPTSLGLSLVAAGLDWQHGDNVVFYPDDYPANVYPWRALDVKGVELRRVNCQPLGDLTLDGIAPLVDKRTRLVALASAHFLSGFRLDVDAVGRFLRERGVLFCLDGIQTFGAFRTMVTHVDFAAADSHKWLLGPLTAGIFYVRRDVQDRLRPVLLGANNVASPNFIAQEELQFPNHAGRYEPSTHNLAGVVGLHAALKLLGEVGIEKIESRLSAFGEAVITGMEGKGFQYIGPREPARRSGILSFTKPAADLATVFARLREQRIFLSLRVTREGVTLLRLSPHFYNTETELNRLLGAL